MSAMSEEYVYFIDKKMVDVGVVASWHRISPCTINIHSTKAECFLGMDVTNQKLVRTNMDSAYRFPKRMPPDGIVANIFEMAKKQGITIYPVTLYVSVEAYVAKDISYENILKKSIAGKLSEAERNFLNIDGDGNFIRKHIRKQGLFGDITKRMDKCGDLDISV